MKYRKLDKVDAESFWSLYEKNGFEVEGVKRKSIFVDGNYLDEFYMAKIK